MAPPIKTIQENGVDVYPQTSADAVVGLKQLILDTMYPVGSIYMTTSNTNPGTVIGGTWSRYAEGRTIIGANSSYPAGGTGGSSTVALNINQIPSHNHTFTGNGSETTSSGLHNHELHIKRNANNGYWQRSGSPCEPGDTSEMDDKTWAYDGGEHTHWFTPSGSISSVGGGGAHDNMMPYISTYIWQRTA